MRSTFASPTRRAERAAGACLLAASLLLGSAARAGAPAPVETRLRAIQERYAGVDDLRAGFEQESHVAALGRTEISRGEVIVQRPGRMRWSYSEPEVRVLALDGETLRLYTPGDRQLQIAPVEGGGLSPTALDFLLGRGDLARDFRAEPIATERSGVEGLRLYPRREGGFDHIELWVRPETSQLVESVLVDLFGNRTRIRFEGMRENTGVGPEDFQLDVPEGTDVLDLRVPPAPPEDAPAPR